jgi:hypothetical protein
MWMTVLILDLYEIRQSSVSSDNLVSYAHKTKNQQNSALHLYSMSIS